MCPTRTFPVTPPGLGYGRVTSFGSVDHPPGTSVPPGTWGGKGRDGTHGTRCRVSGGYPGRVEVGPPSYLLKIKSSHVYLFRKEGGGISRADRNPLFRLKNRRGKEFRVVRLGHSEYRGKCSFLRSRPVSPDGSPPQTGPPGRVDRHPGPRIPRSVRDRRTTMPFLHDSSLFAPGKFTMSPPCPSRGISSRTRDGSRGGGAWIHSCP